MNGDYLLRSFKTINYNTMSYLKYYMQNNIWYVVMAICAIIMIVLYIRTEMDYLTEEKHHIL